MDSEFLGRRIRCVDVDSTTRRRIGENWLKSVALATHRGRPPQPADFSITISARETPTPRHIRDRDAEIGPWGTKHILLGNDEFWILEASDHESSAVHARLGDGTATLELHGTPFVGGMALFAAFGEAMASSGVLYLHAAAIHRDGRTLALLGPSGRGKSTTLLRAIAAGWQPIAEDGCWLEVETMTLLPADESLRLRPGSLELLQAIRPELLAGARHPERLEIPLEKLGPRVLTSTLTDLVYLERSEAGQPAWHPLSPARTVMALHESVGIPHTARVGAAQTRAFGAIVRQTTNSTLRMGAITSPFPAAPPADRAVP